MEPGSSGGKPGTQPIARQGAVQRGIVDHIDRQRLERVSHYAALSEQVSESLSHTTGT